MRRCEGATVRRCEVRGVRGATVRSTYAGCRGLSAVARAKADADPAKLGCEPCLDPGAVSLAAVLQPIVQPARAALPELDRLGSDPEPAPVGRQGYVAGILAIHLAYPVVQDFAVRDRLTLMRDPRA